MIPMSFGCSQRLALGALMQYTDQKTSRPLLNTPTTLAGMALSLALFYRGGSLILILSGLLIFGELALLRPNLGLLFVPFTAPLYLIPASISGIRTTPFLLPVHEAALLIVFGVTVATWLWRRATADEGRTTIGERQASAHQRIMGYAPHLLFLLAGLLGVLLAIERASALREFRWRVVEPLIFYALIKAQVASRRAQAIGQGGSPDVWQMRPVVRAVDALILGGTIVALLGLLQFIGVDLVPLLGEKQNFGGTNTVAAGGVVRVTSVYGHPNNLGLYLERIWPLAAALAAAPLLAGAGWQTRERPGYRWFYATCALICLSGVVVSFSRGSWLASVVALAILLIPVLRRRFNGWLIPALIVLSTAIVAVAGLAVTLRGGLGGGSDVARVLLWRESLAYLRQHPFGIGLDQFYQYHNPDFGRSLIDPSLIGKSDQFASHPHNLVLDIWLRLGPLGLVAFGWLLIRFFRAALRSMRSRAHIPLALGALAAMIAALVHGLVDNFYFVTDLAFVFWLLLGLVETSDLVTRDERGHI
jgi:O-antigen ligase